MQSDLEDNYESFALEYAGFRWGCEDVLPQAELRQLEVIRNLPLDALQALDPAGLTDLERWVYATRMRDDLEAFAVAATLVLDSKSIVDHIALDEAAIMAQCVFQFMVLGASDEARRMAQRFEERFPEDARRTLVSAWACVRETPDHADELFISWAGTDPEACFEVAEDWARLRQSARALAWLNSTEALVATRLDHPIWIDCELLRETLLNHE